jgi:hypothetical protein
MNTWRHACTQDVFESCQRDLLSLDLAAACSGSGVLTAQYWTDMGVLTGDTAGTTRAVTVRSWQVGAAGRADRGRGAQGAALKGRASAGKRAGGMGETVVRRSKQDGAYGTLFHAATGVGTLRKAGTLPPNRHPLRAQPGYGNTPPAKPTTLPAAQGALDERVAHAHAPSPQYQNPTTGDVSSAINSTSTYDPATGLCTNVVAQLNITFFYILTDEADVSVPGVIDTVGAARGHAAGSMRQPRNAVHAPGGSEQAPEWHVWRAQGPHAVSRLAVALRILPGA